MERNCLKCNKKIAVYPCHIKLGRGKYCSRRCAKVGRTSNMKGKKHTQETKDKISKKKKDNPTKYWLGKKRPDMMGEKNYRWAGDTPSYSTLHKRIALRLGKPTKCEHCKKDGLKGRFIQWANKSGNYKRDLNDWIRLCTKCHHKMDNIKEKAWATRRSNA